MTQDEYLRLHPEAAVPTYMGQCADRGLIVIGREFPDEGYATLKCGNTEVKITYTALCSMHLDSGRISAGISRLQDAIYSITCEASLGRTSVLTMESVAFAVRAAQEGEHE